MDIVIDIETNEINHINRFKITLNTNDIPYGFNIITVDYSGLIYCFRTDDTSIIQVDGKSWDVIPEINYIETHQLMNLDIPVLNWQSLKMLIWREE